jgi:hypothetical protein
MNSIYLGGIAIQFKSLVMAVLAFIHGIDAIIGLFILMIIFSSKNNLDH